MPTLEEMRKQAELLAKENREAEPSIERVYWFPSDQEIRLVELTSVVPRTPEDDKVLRPFYFRAAPEDGIIAPSGIAMIRPEEFGHVKLPKGWPSWDQAVEIPNGHGNGNR
jgi:hypothetical protein